MAPDAFVMIPALLLIKQIAFAFCPPLSQVFAHSPVPCTLSGTIFLRISIDSPHFHLGNAVHFAVCHTQLTLSLSQDLLPRLLSVTDMTFPSI